MDIKQRIFVEPPRVAPLPAEIVRCKWSVMIPVYNCAKFLRPALESVLLQAPSDNEMQIEVVDDASTDTDVAQIVNTIGKGRVQYFRQPHNVGSLRNFLTCIERGRGEFIHLLHGDDMVRDGFYQRIAALFAQYPHIGAAYTRFSYVDENGKFLYNHEAEMDRPGLLNDRWLERIIERQRIQYAAMVVRRSVYEHLGAFYGVEYGEDWEMWARISAHYDIGYTPEVLAAYRRHHASISGRSFITGKNMRDLRSVMNRIQRYASPAIRKNIDNRSRKFYAHYALRTANALWKESKHVNGVAAQVKEAWKMYKDLPLFYKIIKLYTRITLNI
jgi:glycosyltransferase involved in cell wall biosynthesis